MVKFLPPLIKDFRTKSTILVEQATILVEQTKLVNYLLMFVEHPKITQLYTSCLNYTVIQTIRKLKHKKTIDPQNI